MFCKKCGKKGKIGDIYCEDCGTKLTKKKIEFKFSKKVKTIILNIVLGLLVLLATYGVVNYIFSPTRLAKQYFETVSKNDISKIYSYMDQYESPLVSEDLLESKINLFSDVAYYNITDVVVTDTQAIVEFTYTKDGLENVVYVLLNKTADYLLFNKYEVSSSKLAKDVQVVVPDNATVTLDNIDIEEYLTTTKDGFKTYNIDYMIAGTYDVEVTVNDVTTKEEYNFDTDSYYYVSNVELSNDSLNQIKEETLNKLNIIYGALSSNSTYSSISSNFANTNKIETNFRELKRNLSDVYTFDSLTLNDISVDSVNYYYDNKIEVSFYIDYTLNYSYGLDLDKVSQSSNNSTYTTMTFNYNDGSYELNEILDYMTLRG